ncbi:MAG TPA: hypothetical protein VNA44_10440 [Burkholderiaceae bacterium]|nr:hypothetical protein [Burkholderiaceae bacterium]
MMSTPREPSSFPRTSLVSPTRLWLLPLLAGTLPFVATLLAFSIAVAEEQFPWCNPLLDGCVSISRAARHGLPNYLFRALLLPAAVFQWLVWLLCAAWLRSIGTPPTRWLRVLPVLGLGAAAFLILYGTFLGTEGPWYRWMRRFGIIFYFGFTCILMLIVGDAVRRAKLPMARYRNAAAVLLALCMTLPLLGLANILAPLVLNNAAAIDVFENATEWWGGLVFTVFFVLLAELWRGTGFAADLCSSAN